MAIVKMDGFDLHGSQAGFETQWVEDGAVTFSTSSGRFGGGGVTINGTSDNAFSYGGNVSGLYVTIGMAVKVVSLNQHYLVGIWDSLTPDGTGGNLQGAVQLQASGAVSIIGDDGANLGNSVDGVISAGDWYYLEFQVKAGTSETAKIFVNGTEVVSGTGDFLDDSFSAYVRFGALFGSFNYVVDDVYIATDATAYDAPLGDVKIETLLPDSDTAQEDWALSAGSDSYALIDDALGTDGDGDTTYISASTLNDATEVGYGNLASTPLNIHAVQLSNRAKKTDAGTIEYTGYLNSNGTTSDGAAVAPSDTSYGLQRDIYETDPDTAASWTGSGVNAVIGGIKITG